MQVNIGLRVLTRPLPAKLPEIYRTLGTDYAERVLPSIIQVSNAVKHTPLAVQSLWQHLLYGVLVGDTQERHSTVQCQSVANNARGKQEIHSAVCTATITTLRCQGSGCCC